jgi:hypothetical protein
MADLHGWKSDPFGLHEQRYFSQGEPTKLVRDGGVESYDPPPATGSSAAPAPVAEPATPPAPVQATPVPESSMPPPSHPPHALESHVALEPTSASPPSPGPGWWLASDGNWYPPETHPDAPIPGSGWWLASDGNWYPPETHPDRSPSWRAGTRAASARETPTP